MEPLPPVPRTVTLQDLVDMGAFQILAEEPGRELVLGAVGKFWTRDFGSAPFQSDAFTAFSRPGYGKIAWSFRVEPHGERRSLLTMDVRTGTTDAKARARFEWYWRLVGPVVRYMSRSALAWMKAELERTRPAEAARGAALLLERLLPSFVFSDVFMKEVRADSAATYASAMQIDALMRKDPRIRILGWLRVAPAALARWLGRRRSSRPETRELESPFKLLAERPGQEYTVGLIGQLWKAKLQLTQFSAEGFAAFDRPGVAKVIVDYLVHPWGSGRSLLVVEVRTATTDAASRQRFRRYWRLLKPFAGLVMRRQLSLIRADAERQLTRPTPAPMIGTVPIPDLRAQEETHA
jgi:hypothetical protein